MALPLRVPTALGSTFPQLDPCGPFPFSESLEPAFHPVPHPFLLSKIFGAEEVGIGKEDRALYCWVACHNHISSSSFLSNYFQDCAVQPATEQHALQNAFFREATQSSTIPEATTQKMAANSKIMPCLPARERPVLLPSSGLLSFRDL